MKKIEETVLKLRIADRIEVILKQLKDDQVIHDMLEIIHHHICGKWFENRKIIGTSISREKGSVSVHQELVYYSSESKTNTLTIDFTFEKEGGLKLCYFSYEHSQHTNDLPPEVLFEIFFYLQELKEKSIPA